MGVCSKCGATIATEPNATEVSDDMRRGEPLVSQNATEVSVAAEPNATEVSDDQGCRVLVQQWMHDHKGKDVTSELLVDFQAAVKSQNFRTSPADQLAAVLEVLAGELCTACPPISEKLQPKLVSEKADPFVKRWSILINDLCDKTGALASMDIILAAVGKFAGDLFSAETTKESVVIGILLSLRNHIDCIDDVHILSGCKKLSSYGVAMTKFIEFLEEVSDDDNAD